MDDEVAPWPRRATGGRALLLAHRGGVGPYRENTLEAFRGAIDFGADGVELDVRRSADGRLVVHHDAEVPGVGAVHDLSAGELPDWIPSLEEALDVCAGAVVNVEVKNSPLEAGFDPDGTLARQAEAELAACGVGTARGPAAVIVSSFWPADLEAVLAGDPARATGLLVHPSLDPVAALDQAAGIGCVALHLFRAQVSAELVDRVHGRALSVAVWTVNEPADLAAASEAGVDVLITDRVAEARAVLAG